MKEVFICDSIRTAIGKFGGTLAAVRPDDLATVPLKALIKRNPGVDWGAVDDVILGCANQAGEDNRNVARMASLLAGLPVEIPGTTINRLCASGMDAVGTGARAIKAGEAEFIIAGGVDSMSRAPYVISKSETAFARSAQMHDSTIGWRFVNPIMEEMYGTDPLPMTGDNVAKDFNISREDQDKFAFWSQSKTKAAQEDGRLAEEITDVIIPQRKGDAIVFSQDEHPRLTPLAKLATLRTVFPGGTVTAANASGVNDGAAAMILATEEKAQKYGLEVKARILGMATAGVEPRIMGCGPIPATAKILDRLGMKIDDFDIIELNEAFASQAIHSARIIGLEEEDERLNPQGGAIALGHPLGMSGTRLVMTAVRQLHRTGGKYALCTMCVGVGQGVAIVIERI